MFFENVIFLSELIQISPVFSPARIKTFSTYTNCFPRKLPFLQSVSSPSKMMAVWDKKRFRKFINRVNSDSTHTQPAIPSTDA